jgi:hypothetical protein
MKHIKQVGIPFAIVIITVVAAIVSFDLIKLFIWIYFNRPMVLIYFFAALFSFWVLYWAVLLISVTVFNQIHSYYYFKNNITTYTEYWTYKIIPKTNRGYLVYPNEKKIRYRSENAKEGDVYEVYRETPNTDLIFIRWFFVLFEYDKKVIKKIT